MIVAERGSCIFAAHDAIPPKSGERVLGSDLQRARRVASQIRAGRVVINGMTDDPQAPWADLNIPASAVNTANTGSRRFSKPEPYLSLKEALS
jgi:hypothetical protein